jgi:cysteine sulfinate desulfinase/cysteine desulfurase-like protein
MKIPYEVARGSIRFSLGRYNTPEEIDDTLAELTHIVSRLLDKPLPKTGGRRAGLR